MEHNHAATLQLPLAVISPVDVGRLGRELAALDDYLSQAALRKSEEPPALPRTSKLLEELARQNGTNLLTKTERSLLLEFMQTVARQTPVLHFSFAADPSPAFLRQLIEWLRREIHPLVLVQVGLQPSIAAGCVLRTSNKYFDFSLRRHFTERRQELIDRLGATT